MAFDSETRRRLAGFVTAARGLLQSEFAELLPSTFGIRSDGTSDPLESLSGLDEQGLQLAETLRERITYLAVNLSTEKTDAAKTKWAVDQLAREQAFTVLNRLAAIRMAEKRGIVQESVAKGFQSKAFRVFENLAGNSLGETFPKYRQFLNCLFDELAVDLGLLFDRNAPQGLLFPRETAFLKLLELFNDRDLENLWAEDETIGWIYQYYNDAAERKEMRDKSAAPRNSRELAVRNQFFTPRYVVEFLTDNTLGRIWYEMCQGQTNLKDRCHYLVRRQNEIFLKEGEATPEQPHQENLSQEELLKQPVYIPHRQLKDPRTILMLDPACGSMHFGLYAFDLLEEIYHEAWDREEQNPGALIRPKGLKPLHQSYTDKSLFLADIPRLIIEHNIHGVDIDPRATQIAALSLWLRAHRTWNDQKTPLAQRPRITKSHIVCAEPMPGDPALLQEFVKASFPVNEHSLFQRLLEQIFVKMQLAGEAGSLLKIEEEITSAVEEAKVTWAKSRSASNELFGTAEMNAAKKPGSQADLLGLDTALLALDVTTDFWGSIEERIYAALRDYAEQAESGAGFQHRLFAEDAARGFAFIDVCRKSYDVALMNPPFGLMPGEIYRYLIIKYPNAYSDLALSFMARGSQWTRENGLVGAITSRAFLNVSDAEKFRRSIAINHMRLIADFGVGVMDDAFVDASAQILTNSMENHLWIKDARKVEDKASPLQKFLQTSPESPAFVFPHSHFETIPKCRFAYDSGKGLGSILSSKNSIEPVFGIARTGASTFEDDRFLRLNWEIEPKNLGRDKTWCWIARTAPDFCQFYYPYEIATRWNGDGAELCERNRQVNGQIAQARQGSAHYFKPGIVFSRRSRPSIAFRVHPQGSVFSSGCGVVFPTEFGTALFLMGILNSRFVRAAIHTLTTYSYTVGHIRAILAPQYKEPAATEVAALAARLVRHKQRCFRLLETDHFFFPYQLSAKEPGLRLVQVRVAEFLKDIESQMLADQRDLDTKVASIFAIENDVDTGRFKIKAENIALPQWLTKLGVQDFVANTVSESLGIAFGRWDIRYATGEQAAPELPDPFTPLPVCPPGQLQNAQGLPARPEDVPAAYPVRIPWDGILVDDPNHPLDLERRVREVVDIIWSGKDGGPTAEAIEHEACEILGVKSLRDYFRKPAGFFADHLKRYSKSRRQAPIYWPLSSSKGNYTLWIYYHRLNDQTLHTVLLDFVEPKLEALKNEISHLRETNGAPTRLAELLDFENEMKEFELEIKRIIDLPWKPNLNDGVLITASPLWKLFRLPKWQKDLKATWQELEKGDYDWAHLAYSIWPARVEEKCKSDRSMAIAHGLEHLCTVEAPKPKRGRKANS